MGMTRNGAVRCDGCGKLSRHLLGEYTRPDGTAGYINSHGRNSDVDYCEECEADRCPGCGSDLIVHVTPATPGPTGWGGRCKACGHRWYWHVEPLPPIEADLEG